MYEKLMFMWRTAAQLGVGAVAAWLVARGFNLDPQLQTAFEAAVFGAGVWVYGIVVHWLETRPGDGIFAKGARALARILMLGAPANLTYQRPVPEAVQAVRSGSAGRY